MVTSNQDVAFNTRKLVKNLGGVRAVTRSINKFSEDEIITFIGVDKWMRRNSLPLLHLCRLAIIAKQQNHPFDLYDYISIITPKEDGNDANL